MLSVHEVRERLQAQLVATLDGWHPSRHSYEQLPDVPDGAERSHQSFALAVPSTTTLPGRQRRDVPQPVVSTVDVRWLYRLRPGNHDEDYALALRAEERLRWAVLAVHADPELKVQLEGDATRRTLTPDTGPMVLGEMRFLVVHQIPLQAS